MILNASPDRCCAVVVGIERYEFGTNWNLHGPASDALRFVAWLDKRGLRTENIKVFLSITEDFDRTSIQGVVLRREDDELIIELRPDRKIIVERATQELIRKRLVDPSWSQDAQVLFIFWGGHGALEDTSDDRYLYCADACKGDESGINITKQLRYLRSTRFNAWQYQIVFVDACAELLSVRAKSVPTKSLPERNFKLNPKIKQFILHAAATGQLAANLRSEATGKFSKTLFEMLNATGAQALRTVNGWPHFGELAECMKQRFEGHTQSPMVFMSNENGPRWTVNDNRPPLASYDNLIDLLNRLPTVSLEGVQRAYQLATLRVPNPPPRTPDSTAAVIRILATFVQVEAGLSVLERFVAKLYVLIQSGGAAGDAAALQDWLSNEVQDQPALRSFLDTEAAQSQTVAYLLVDVVVLRAWLFRPGMLVASWSMPDDAGTKDLESALGLALDWAAGSFAEDELVVELMVPRRLLGAGLDRLTISLPEVSGMTPRLVLGIDHVVYLRLRERLLGKSPSFTSVWRRVASQVFAGMEKGGPPFGVRWLNLGCSAAGVKPNERSPWIGLTCMAADGGGDLLNEILCRGAPLLLWPVEPISDVEEFKCRLKMLLAEIRICELPAALKKAALQGRTADFALIVDAPDRRPPGKLFGDPPQKALG